MVVRTRFQLTEDSEAVKMEHPVPPPPPPVLPKHTELSPQQFAFLEEHFRTREDVLVGAPHLSAALNKRCAYLDADLLHLQRYLSNRAVSWISRSFAARTSIHHLNLKLENLSLRSAPRSSLLPCTLRI
jgi:hypothetical protein